MMNCIKKNAFSERISINQLLILKYESKFSENINPTEGAYYVESITQKLETGFDYF